MTKAAGHSSTKLQELLADYLSQNLKDGDDNCVTNIASDAESGRNDENHRKRHKHKSKKKKRKSHHSNRDESKHRKKSHHRRSYSHRREHKSDCSAEEEWEEKSYAPCKVSLDVKSAVEPAKTKRQFLEKFERTSGDADVISESKTEAKDMATRNSSVECSTAHKIARIAIIGEKLQDRQHLSEKVKMHSSNEMTTTTGDGNVNLLATCLENINSRKSASESDRLELTNECQATIKTNVLPIETTCHKSVLSPAQTKETEEFLNGSKDAKTVILRNEGTTGASISCSLKNDAEDHEKSFSLAASGKMLGKISIKDLSSCVALKMAEDPKEVKATCMEEGELEDSDNNDNINKDKASSASSLNAVADDESAVISTDDEERTKSSLEKKKKKGSKHKDRKRKRKVHEKKLDGEQKTRKKQKHSIEEKNRSLSSSLKPRSARSPKHGGRSRSPAHRRKRSHSPVDKSPLQGSRNRGHWRSRSKSPRKPLPAPSDLREKIDKKRLLEIARKNVLQMMQDGTLPAGLSIGSLKQEHIVALKAGGKGVDELTEFCRGLVETGNGDSSGNSSDEKPRSEDENELPFIHHPFKLRDPQPTIRMNIRNAIQLPTRTPAEKTVDAARLRLQFPVSSGSHHRNKELEWVPVEKTDEVTTAAQKKGKEVAVIKPPEPPKNVNPLTQFFAPGPIDPAPLMPPPQTVQPPPEPVNEVFPAQKKIEMDIATAMLMRVKAVQKLQENPHDVEAMNQMFHAQQQMQQWAQSKLLPGQFGAVGETRMLTPEELSGPSPVWVRKELFQKAAPLRGGIGMHLLKKMGWNPGEGLGKNKEGSLEPLVLDIKTDKKGLVSTGELPQKVNLPAVKLPRDLSAKHPVSALMELCSKRKWGSPDYTLLDETGPAHRKTFLFKVRVMGTDYQPSVSSYNKKQAKAMAASVCLQSMGLIPRNLDNPL